MAQDSNIPTQQDEIEPLSDESLEEVAGGNCSGAFCSSSAKV
jgi:hypothetical protein